MTIDRGDAAASVGTNADTLDATKVVVTPVGGLAATTGQAAFQELDADLTTEITRAQAAEALLQPLDADLTALAGLASAADKLPYFTGAGAAALADLSTFMRTLTGSASAAAFLSTLGYGLFGQTGIPVNFSLSAAVASNALTMSVKGADGSAPSATNPVYFPMRSSTATSGGFNWRSVTAALSLTISSGSTLGHNSALKQYIYWYAIDNAGTVELAASSKFFGTHGIVSTTAEGGAGAADSGTVMYSTTARSNVPFLCIGYSEDTQTTAGTWAAAPSQINLSPFSHPCVSFAATTTGESAVTSGNVAHFDSERYDNGSLYDNTNYKWVPPPGTVKLFATLSYSGTITDQKQYGVLITKNGSEILRQQIHASGVGGLSPTAAGTDEANGTDYYQVVFNHGAVGGPDTNGASTFCGVWSPQRS